MGNSTIYIIKILPFSITFFLAIISIIALSLADQSIKLDNKNQSMAAAANPYATKAAIEILTSGGSAMDAAIAAALVLGLVEPQSSGIGGGGFLLHFDSNTKKVSSFDGRETAPAEISKDIFQSSNGTLLDWKQAASGGLPVGVPGLISMLYKAHKSHGKLPWSSLFGPAINLAQKGFTISPRLEKSIKSNLDLANFPNARKYFFSPNGQPLKAGNILTNLPYARSLIEISKHGPKALHRGNLAKQIVSSVQNSEINNGFLGLEDLEHYEALEREPICKGYRDWVVCGMGPPSSGGLTLLQILGILSHFELSKKSMQSLEVIHLISEASRLAYADRAQYMADRDFVKVPISGLLDENYIKSRAILINPKKAMNKVIPGTPPEINTNDFSVDISPEFSSTTHLVVVDYLGNAVSLTASIERAFGSRLMVGGFMLNNQLTDFSFSSQKEGRMTANRVEPRKRPRSSMSPVLVFDKSGNLVLALGSPGGSRIIGYVLNTLVAILDFGLTPSEALKLPHHVNIGKGIELEKGTSITNFTEGLKLLGHEVSVRALNSGIHVILVTKSKLLGGADPRREGTVLELVR